MILDLKQATTSEGKAAAASATTATVPGYVLQAEAMQATLDERQEQVTNLLKVRGDQNNDAVAEDLKDVILTVHVPQEVEDALEKAFNDLEKPLLMRLSPIGSVDDPLTPTIIIGLEDMKSVLDALRMLYAEMYSAANIAVGDTDHSAAIIIQPAMTFASTYRVLRGGQHTVIEATQGIGSWVGYGDPERYLFTGDELTKGEPGNHDGIFYDHGFREGKREALSVEGMKEAYEYAKQFDTQLPLLIGRKADGTFICYGCLSN